MKKLISILCIIIAISVCSISFADRYDRLYGTWVKQNEGDYTVIAIYKDMMIYLSTRQDGSKNYFKQIVKLDYDGFDSNIFYLLREDYIIIKVEILDDNTLAAYAVGYGGDLPIYKKVN